MRSAVNGNASMRASRQQRTQRFSSGALALLAALTLGAPLAALADPPGPGRDGHYDRGHYYPPPGRVYDHPPPGGADVHWHGAPYYYHGGSWYHHDGDHWVVVLPPVGIVAPFLPPYYSTFWVGGYPYYYANDAYYTWHPPQGYVVTQPPPANDQQATPPASDLFVYPMHGQSEQQQATDRYECHAWAVGETGFDPVKPQGGVDAASWAHKREDYQRALAACLSARGYSVR